MSESQHDHSDTVRLSNDPLLEIRIPMLAGLALIKLIAWHDAYPERQKDAEDLKLRVFRILVETTLLPSIHSHQHLVKEKLFSRKAAKSQRKD